MARAGEENKKLKKKVAEMEARQLSWVSADEHSSKTRALNEEITTLTKRLAISEQQLDRLREEKKKLIADIDSVSKELNMAKAREKAVQKQEEENLINMRKY
jgi:chromosome segregation ATPase